MSATHTAAIKSRHAYLGTVVKGVMKINLHLENMYTEKPSKMFEKLQSKKLTSVFIILAGSEASCGTFDL